MPFITLRPPIYRSGSSPSRPSRAHPPARSAIAEIVDDALAGIMVRLASALRLRTDRLG
jgi:hypothetical protein